jgi:hypothetical protein
MSLIIKTAHSVIHRRWRKKKKTMQPVVVVVLVFCCFIHRECAPAHNVIARDNTSPGVKEASRGTPHAPSRHNSTLGARLFSPGKKKSLAPST